MFCQVSNAEIKKRTLRFSVYDVTKRRGARGLIGHALVSLDDVDPAASGEILWRELDDIAHVSSK